MVLIRGTSLTGTGAIQPAKRKVKDGQGSSEAFSLDADPQETIAAAATGSAASLNGVDALLALQELDGPAPDSRKALRQGYDLLDELEQLKLSLLEGRVSPQQLDKILNLVRMRVASGNRELDETLGQIEVRARIELAKLGQFVD
ncbi:flagellar assembly regulator FliX [Rhodobacteraceae bacterium RKSG542]|uniref:flagellar assembly protein FliX n=1 Tax=Pseudovibrio flavus TaxID=2529854 RepID=UPI0012BCD01F|nr:flagellar assembly protein FliX [Pseudovibrio flavus]MTI19268.1 flagellar assembly regulator FliX [Pseudovibrio flavus]